MEQKFSEYTVEELYEAIGQVLVGRVPEGWQQLTFNFEWLAEDVVKKNSTYQDEHGKTIAFSVRPATFMLSDLFIALGRRMGEAGHPRWQRANFTLAPDGQFDLNFVYPDGDA